MYCIECGTKNEDRAKFCMVCGSPMPQPETVPAVATLISAPEEPPVAQETVIPVPEVQPVAEVPVSQEQPKYTPQTKSSTGIICRILGAVLLLCAILPHFLESQFSPFLQSMMAQYSANSVAAYSMLLTTRSIGTLFSGFAYIALLVAGMGLLLNRQGLKKLLIVCLVACSVHTVSLLAITGWITSAPGTVASLFGNSNLAEAAEQLFQSVPAVRDAFEDQLLTDILPLLIALAATIASLILAVRASEDVRLSGKCDRGAASLYVLWPLHLIFSIITRVADALGYEFFGNNMWAANSYANQAITTELSDILWLVTLLALLGGLWLRKRKTWQLWLPLAGTVALAVAVLSPSVFRSLELRGIPEEVMSSAFSLVQVLLVTTVLETGTLTYWYLASARGQLPAWLQPILVLARSVVYLLTSILVVTGFRSYELAMLLASVHACAAVIAIALPVSMARARRARQTIQ